MASATKRIMLATPTMHGDEMQYIQEAFDRNWIAPLGFNCDGFEEEIAAYMVQNGATAPVHTLALSSGTGAMHLAVKLAGIKPGDTVLCSDMTFAASVNPVLYEGGVPVFVDSERETWNMDPRALEAAFERHPEAKAVVLAYLYGTPGKMDEITEICRRHGAILVEDAAEALSAKYKGQPCGTIGDIDVLSFNGNKIITTSGGGMLITHDKALRDRAQFWATQAKDPAPWYQHSEIGYNYRMSNIVAGIGRGQLHHLEEHHARKEAIYRRYEEGLRGLPLTMNPYEKGVAVPNFWLSCILIDRDCPVTFIEVMDKLAAANIESRPIWKPMHLQPVFEKYDFVTVEESPVDEDVFSRGLCLPSDIKMTPEEQDLVMEVLRDCFRG